MADKDFKSFLIKVIGLKENRNRQVNTCQYRHGEDVRNRGKSQQVKKITEIENFE